MKLTEPVTAVTDYILAIELVILGILVQLNGLHQSVNLWGASFFAIGLAAFAGGIFHGSREALSPTHSATLQKLIPVAVVVGLVLMILAGIFSAATGPVRWALIVITLFVFSTIVFVFLTRQQNTLESTNFFRYIFTMICIFSALLAYEMIATGPLSGRWILLGSLTVMIAAAIQQKGIRIHKHMNHNDLCHLILMTAFYFLYRGGLLLRDH